MFGFRRFHAWLLYVVRRELGTRDELLRLQRQISEFRQEVRMAFNIVKARVEDAAREVAAKVVVLEGKIDEAVTTLGELKEIVDAADETSALAVLAEVSEKLDSLTAKLGDAETAADPTPDAPAGGAE